MKALRDAANAWRDAHSRELAAAAQYMKAQNERRVAEANFYEAVAEESGAELVRGSSFLSGSTLAPPALSENTKGE